MKVGDRVVHHTGSYGSEQGQMGASWQPYNEDGVIVEVAPDRVLVERGNGERKWASLSAVTPKREQPPF